MRKSIPFSTFIAGICIAIILSLSIVLIRASVLHSREVSNSLSQDIISSYTEVVQAKIGLLSAPLATILDTLALTDFVHAEMGIHDPVWLDTLAKILAKSPQLSTLYYGDENGNSFMVRPIYDEQTAQKLHAPENSVIMIDQNIFNGLQNRIFFDKNMQMINSFPYENGNYDPRQRPWFVNTSLGGEINITQPYFFYFFKHLGITFSRRSLDGESVIAADFTLDSLNNLLKDIGYSPNSQAFLLTKEQGLVASTEMTNSFDPKHVVTAEDLHIANFLPDLNEFDSDDMISRKVEWQGKDWQLVVTPMVFSSAETLYLVNFISLDDMFAKSADFLNELLKISVITVVLSFLIVLAATLRVVSPLTTLVNSLTNIQRFSFKKKRYRRSYITEIDRLNETMQMMESVLHDFFQNLRNVARSTAPEEISRSLVVQVQDILGSDNCLLYTNSASCRSSLTLTASVGDDDETNLQRLFDANPVAFEQGVYELTPDEIVSVAGDKVKTCFMVPLFNRNNNITGALLICFDRDIELEVRSRIGFVREFIGFNEIVLEHLEKVEEQTNLFHSFVMMTASAVDAKSPYTGGHCQRVPELTRSLAQEVTDDDGDFADFELSDKEWEELLVAAWLHDCGKVSTPDFIMDKATKLETVYDRLHEIRMRYEVLKRDADIVALQSILDGDEAEHAELVCAQQKAILDEEFSFIASCNLGSEFLADDKVDRLNSIAKRTWLRTLPDNIGIAHHEAEKKTGQDLPVVETVLADKPEHLFIWEEKRQLRAESERDFKMKQPDYQHNRGELHNLMIRGGTLTDEDRYSINEHIVQTYLMLDQLPYPEHLKNVPIIAGSHHERIDGKGYPLQLAGDEIPLQGRMVAIADVFEALTASDRPYKEAKSLSLALTIMANMVNEGHLDKQLFDLFLREEVYLSYAEKFLNPGQLDDIDVNKIQHIYQ